MSKLIITAAVTGSLPRKEKTPYVPISPDEIAEDVKQCYDAGAAICHIHARDEEENVTHNLDIFTEIYEKIKKACPNIIIQISTGGRAGLTYESRSQGLKLNPETASLTTGSVNFPNMVYENSPELIEKLAIEMKERSIKPEIEIFDTSMIPSAIELHKKGILEGPLYFNFIMGLKNCQEATYKQLSHILNLIPDGSIWNISGVGKNQLFTTFAGISLGGNVRVGLEDNIYYQKGKLATNAEFVARVVKLAREYGREIATSDEAREILKLKKSNKLLAALT